MKALTLGLVLALPVLRAEDAAAPGKGPAVQAFELRMSGKAGPAKELLATALEGNPGDTLAQFEMARVCFYLLDLDAAGQAIGQAVKLQPEDGRYHYWMGLISIYSAIWKHKSPESRGDVPRLMKAGLGAFKKAMALKPDFHEARFELINCYAKNPRNCGGSQSKAKKQTEALERESPAHGAKARCLLLPHREADKRRTIWEKLVTEHPDDADAHEGLARACFGTDKGLQHLNKTLALDPGRGEILIDLARHHAMAKRYGDADNALKRYLDSEPVAPVPMRAYATFCLAKIQKMQGNDKRADELMAEAKKLDPNCWTFFRQPHRALFDPP